MLIRIVSPAPLRSVYGNAITALRWAGILRGLGHRVEYGSGRCDLVIALHARKSAEAMFHSRTQNAILALTGTDVYQDIRTDATAQHAVEAASRLVVLQPLALDELAAHLRPKARVIYQSAEPVGVRPRKGVFQVCVVGHLRKVKDPFRAAAAAGRLPESSRIRVVHAGAAREEAMERLALAEESRNARYKWLGRLSAAKARRLIAGSRLMVISSKMEGGANAIVEAVVDGVPVLASRVPGNVGMLGDDYPGYFPFGDTAALAGLLARAETDRAYYAELKARCRKLAPRFRPERERAAWKKLLAEFG